MSRRPLSAYEKLISERLGRPELHRVGAGTLAVWPKGADGRDPYLTLHSLGGRESMTVEFVGLQRAWTIAGGGFPMAPLADLASALAEAVIWMDAHRIGGPR